MDFLRCAKCGEVVENWLNDLSEHLESEHGINVLIESKQENMDVDAFTLEHFDGM